MGNFYKWFLVIPLLLFGLGTYILLSGETAALKLHTPLPVQANKSNNAGNLPRPRNTLGENLESNRNSAYPYFLLGSCLLVALLVLPKLSELSFSPTAGFTLKVLDEVKEVISEVKTTAQAVETKTKQTFNPDAPNLLLATKPDLSQEIKKLEENATKLNTYSNLLESLVKVKNK